MGAAAQPVSAHYPAEPSDSSATRMLEEQLAAASTARDSITILTNLFDLNLKTEKGKYSTPLYNLAMRTKDFDTQLDVIRNIANNFWAKDSVLQLCLAAVHDVPESYNQMETDVYLRMRIKYGDIYRMSDSAAVASLPMVLTGFRDDDMMSTWERLVGISEPTFLLARTVAGNMYQSYMDMMVKLAESLPEGNGSAKSLVYTNAANIYTDREEYAKAVHMDSLVLDIIDSLDVVHSDNGRLYRNLDRNRYICYRRQLVNYPGLAPEDAEHIFHKLQGLTADNPGLRGEFDRVKRAQGFYLLATGQYGAALPVLKEALAVPKNQPFKRQILKGIIKSAEATGNLHDLLEATKAYNTVLEEYSASQANDKVKELNLIMDINEGQIASNEEIITALEAQNARLSLYINIFGALAAILLVAFVIAVRIAHLRKRQQGRRQ